MKFNLFKKDTTDRAEIEYHKIKVAYLSRVVLENPNNTFRQAELRMSLQQLNKLLTS